MIHVTKSPDDATNQKLAPIRLHGAELTRETGPGRDLLEPQNEVMSIGFSAKVEADLAGTSRNAS